MKRNSGHSQRGAPPGRASGNGRPDADILFSITKYLRQRYGIPLKRSKIDHTIRITDGKVEVLGRMTYEEISLIRGLVHTPDVLVVDEEGVPVLIIEQDGMSHNSKERIQKDKARNEHYKSTGIPFIIMRTSVIKSLGVSSATYLDGEMKKLGWRPCSEPGADMS